MAQYPQQHLDVPKIPMVVLAVDTISHLPITSNGNRWTSMAISQHTSYVFTVSMKEKLAENIVQTYSAGILSHKGASVAILTNNGTEFKKIKC